MTAAISHRGIRCSASGRMSVRVTSRIAEKSMREAQTLTPHLLDTPGIPELIPRWRSSR
jgi:hypothetical protein